MTKHHDRALAIPVPGAVRALDMDLGLAARACLAQLPSLAARRLRMHLAELAELQRLAERCESAQRLAGKLFSLMANASVHCGDANTLRPLFEQLSLVRTFLWLRRHVAVSAPEPLVRGAPDLVVDVAGGSIWVDTRARALEVLAERGRNAMLVVDRTVSWRREPPLCLGTGYAGEFHLLDTRRSGEHDPEAYVLEQQAFADRAGPGPAATVLAEATDARHRPSPRRETGLEHSA